ncbi:hypothetical protein [Herminiimonas aquatilis]|uniref:Uncharacterized protein n=1 Tax=Herminiimonas aquatilis TaxID=345342 RepID=A0ABW2J885_9BURK
MDESHDFTGDCKAQRLTLHKCTLTLRKPQNNVSARKSLDSRPDIALPGMIFAQFIAGALLHGTVPII